MRKKGGHQAWPAEGKKVRGVVLLSTGKEARRGGEYPEKMNGKKRSRDPIFIGNGKK